MPWVVICKAIAAKALRRGAFAFISESDVCSLRAAAHSFESKGRYRTSFGINGWKSIICNLSRLLKVSLGTIKSEIWAGRRQPAQLISKCHRQIYMNLLKQVGSQKEIGRIRSIYQCQPLDGICESTITVRFGDRLRAMVIRFEGVDQRWLCTELRLI